MGPNVSIRAVLAQRIGKTMMMLSKHNRWPALFSLILIGLTDFLFYVRLDAGQWAPRETTMAVMLSLFPIAISLPFEEMFVSRYPRFRYAVRLLTPVYSLGFTLVIWPQVAIAIHG